MIKSIVMLMGGNIFSQILPILFIPLLTRLYTPEQFGVLAFYLSIATLVGGIATGKYEQKAVVLSGDKSKNLFLFSIITSFLVCFLFGLLLFVLSKIMPDLLGELNNYYYLIALGVLSVAVYQSFTYWAVNEKLFLNISINKVVQSLLLISISVYMYYTSYNELGLIMGEFLSRIIAAIILFYFLYKKIKWNFNIQDILKDGFENYGTPLRLVPAVFMNLSAKQLPIYFFTIVFGPTFVGFFMISQRLIMTPLSVISTSVSQVFLQKTALEFKEKGECRKTYLMGLIGLSCISLPPLIFAYIYIEPLAVFFLGNQWAGIGVYIKVLLPFYYIYFVSGTLNILIISSGKEYLNLFVQFVYFLATLLLMIYIYFVEPVEVAALTMYSIIMSIYFVFTLVVTRKISRGRINE